VGSQVCCLQCWAAALKWETQQGKKTHQPPVGLQDSFQRSTGNHPVLYPATIGDSSPCHLKNGCPMSLVGARLLCPWHSWDFSISHRNGNSPSTGGLAQLYQSSTSREPFQGDMRLKGVQLTLTQIQIFILCYIRLEAWVDLGEEGRERLSRAFYLYGNKYYGHERTSFCPVFVMQYLSTPINPVDLPKYCLCSKTTKKKEEH